MLLLANCTGKKANSTSCLLSLASLTFWYLHMTLSSSSVNYIKCPTKSKIHIVVHLFF